MRHRLVTRTMHAMFDYAKIDYFLDHWPLPRGLRGRPGGTPLPQLETIVGRIVHVGPFTKNAHLHTYSLVEIETSTGRVDLRTVGAANEVDRVIEPGRSVAMTVLRSGSGAKAKHVVLAVHDRDEKRTFANEEMFALRAHTRKQAVLLSLISIVALPVAFLFFVVPGFVWLWLLWKAWSSIGDFPTVEEIRRSVASLESAGTSPTPSYG